MLNLVMKQITLLLFIGLAHWVCDFQTPWNSQWIEGEDGILYVQKIDKPETREPYTGDMIKEYDGRKDRLVKEQLFIRIENWTESRYIGTVMSCD